MDVDFEREAVRLGALALDRALISLVFAPVAHNADFRVADPAELLVPSTVLECDGVAPLRFVFRPYLDLWVGPFSEVLLVEVTEALLDNVENTIAKVLQSSVICRPGLFRSTTVELRLESEGQTETWAQLKSFGAAGRGPTAPLKSRYRPYVQAV